MAVLARAAAIGAAVVIVAVLSLYALRTERPGSAPDAPPASTDSGSPPTSRWMVVDIATRQATDVAAGGLHFVSRGVLLR